MGVPVSSNSMATRGGMRFGSGAAHGVPRPDLGFGDGEHRGVGGDHEVALLRQQEAAGVGDAVHRGDERLVDLDVAAGVGEEVGRRDGQRVVWPSP